MFRFGSLNAFQQVYIIACGIILLGVVAVVGFGRIDWGFLGGATNSVESHMVIFDKGKPFYLDGRSSEDRSSLYWVGEMLADDLSYGKATAEQVPQVAERLDWLLRNTGMAGMSEKDLGRRERISLALATYQSTQVQIKAIEDKKCGAVSTASISPGGQPTVSAVEVICQ